MAAAWRALGQLDTRALVTHRFPFARAAEAYRLLDSGGAEALQVVLQLRLSSETHKERDSTWPDTRWASSASSSPSTI